MRRAGRPQSEFSRVGRREGGAGWRAIRFRLRAIPFVASKDARSSDPKDACRASARWDPGGGGCRFPRPLLPSGIPRLSALRRAIHTGRCQKRRRPPHRSSIAGTAGVKLRVVLPTFRSGDGKQMVLLTLSAIQESVVAMRLADLAEVRRLLVELQRFTEDERTIMSLPRIFQVWGVAPL